MTPEARAREHIDRKLERAGWVVQDLKLINLGAARGVAVREYPTDTGPADYVLFIDREAVGVIEAKRDEEAENITAHEAQTARYAHAALKWRMPNDWCWSLIGRCLHVGPEFEGPTRSGCHRCRRPLQSHAYLRGRILRPTAHIDRYEMPFFPIRLRRRKLKCRGANS